MTSTRRGTKRSRRGAAGVTITKKCVRDAARMLMFSAGPKQKDVLLGIRVMRDVMLGIIDGRRKTSKKLGATMFRAAPE